ncbi:MAG TPA: glycerophosphodiester phosphodiesterase, partial [Candidatus Caccovivens faecavium]|nr:glycerophosphodiester phosphodiesterase [Candidatus Caccovivens faecavium]
MEDIFKSWLVETPIAHRGLHDKVSPENSLSAFEKAVENGYAIELDVQLLADDTVVVFHDESLSRMTGNDGYIKFLNKEDLKVLKLGNSKEHIPTFEEVLKLVNGRTPLLIEIKNQFKVGKLEQKVIALLKDYKGEYAVQSFNPFSL